jgi:hypothetical protein
MVDLEGSCGDLFNHLPKFARFLVIVFYTVVSEHDSFSETIQGDKDSYVRSVTLYPLESRN